MRALSVIDSQKQGKQEAIDQSYWAKFQRSRSTKPQKYTFYLPSVAIFS